VTRRSLLLGAAALPGIALPGAADSGFRLGRTASPASPSNITAVRSAPSICRRPWARLRVPDYDGDGWLDILLITGWIRRHKKRRSTLHLFQNNVTEPYGCHARQAASPSSCMEWAAVAITTMTDS
jgi:hypothetical protein